MAQEQRKKTRRHSDRVLRKVVEILQILEKLSEGEQVDFTEAYADLVGMKDQLGRRKEDRRLGDDLCATLGTTAAIIVQHAAEPVPAPAPAPARAHEERLRKVRLTKASQTKKGADAAVVGWEESPPALGKSYKIFTDTGGVFRTSILVKVAPGYIRTRNSLYEVQVLEVRGD